MDSIKAGRMKDGVKWGCDGIGCVGHLQRPLLHRLPQLDGRDTPRLTARFNNRKSAGEMRRGVADLTGPFGACDVDLKRQALRRLGGGGGGLMRVRQNKQMVLMQCVRQGGA